MGIREVEVAGKTVTIHELDDVSDPLTGRALTGSWVWDSALILSKWMSNHGRLDFDFHGRTVVELGAGSGLPGLTAALLGANRVVLTDVAQLLPGLRKNVEDNELGDRVEVRELVWGSDTSDGDELGNVDLVVMSDLFYDTSETAALAKTLKRLCGSETKIWSASEVRPWTVDSLNELRREGFRVVELPSQLVASSSSLSSSMATEEDPPSFVVFLLVPPGCDSGAAAAATEIIGS